MTAPSRYSGRAMVRTTEVLPLSDDAIARAARLILAGEPVAVPTETVYGLAADATNPQAVARIYAAKGRPSFNPLIVHVPDLAAAEAIGRFSGQARLLAQKHWPGPLTLVVPLREDSGIASLVTAGLSTIAIRVPAHPAMQALLKAAGRPLAAPSANASGRISPTRTSHVLASLGGRIALIIDGGATERGIESTIVASTDSQLRLLRRGPIEIDGAELIASASVEAPGQLESHYAPSKPLRLDATERAFIPRTQLVCAKQFHESRGHDAPRRARLCFGTADWTRARGRDEPAGLLVSYRYPRGRPTRIAARRFQRGPLHADSRGELNMSREHACVCG